jgi:uncharacterized membrane protein
VRFLYLLAVWAHIFTVCLWVGAMFFADPASTRFFSRLFERRLRGIGWYAHGVLWPTGFFMLYVRGITPAMLFSGDFLATAWGRVLWAKIGLVLTLVVFQIWVGNRPSKLVYGYILVAAMIVGLSVMLVRPALVGAIPR